MLNRQRQQLVLELIKNNEIETQEDLVVCLRSAGCEVTQATASRDIKDLQLIKGPGKQHKYCYKLPVQDHIVTQNKFTNIVRDCVVSIEAALNLVVVRTVSGAANSVGVFLDSLMLAQVRGSIAGDDCLLVIARNESDAADVVEHLKKYF